LELAVPRQELLMRAISFSRGRNELAGRVDDPFNTTSVIDLAVNDDHVIIGYAYQAPVEHPMRCA
jgi:hypothetical protein